MSAFIQRLADLNPDPAGRRWLFVPYDQLSADLGPLSREPAEELGIVVVETTWKGRRRRYHKQKLALILANLRHFALEQAERGVAVRHVAGEASYGELLRPLARELGGLQMMEAAERELRVDLAPLVEEGLLEVLPHEGWLTDHADFVQGAGEDPPWRMDAFYRQVRGRTGILMDDGSPVGGKYSFDAENRKPWKGDPPAAEEPTFPLDPIKEEVLALVEETFPDHPGTLRPEYLPATAADAEALWQWAREACLPTFGPYEDAMSTRSRTLFHTRIAHLLNLHRLLPRRVVGEAEAMDIPLAGKEGFIRQILGWREFVRHVHRTTDGFRELAPEYGGEAEGSKAVRNGGDAEDEGATEGEGGANPSVLGARHPLPAAWWGTPSGMRCLDEVVEGVWEEGYGHHITRLMILSNLATLLDISPRELTDWFWVAYTDAYDWVVEPNVLGMGTFAVGELMTTKPYVSGTPYIRKMSDYCDGCALDPDRSCPISDLYWAFLARHEEALKGNRRMSLPLGSMRRRSAGKKEADRRVFEAVRGALDRGEAVTAARVERARDGSD
ncbi:MAG: deoxyribodipyrimidine photolyase [Gemmatimonadales bacterium]|nr:MAG: deoxyribodipyrimidine photolyase [Gemmatimonadales bacterium]